jgi:FkbM family methyltransferase
VNAVIKSWPAYSAQNATNFCERFILAKKESRFLFGCNVYSQAVAKILEVAGFVETDPTRDKYIDLPIISLDSLHADAIVLSCAGGRPLSASATLAKRGIDHLDYFAFKVFSGLDLPDAVFNEGGPRIIEENSPSIEWLYTILADEGSRHVLNKIIAFRRSYDLTNLAGFSERQREQYFEGFLTLDASDAVFVDVGCFDGLTSLEFAHRFPRYSSIIALEPDPLNFRRCQASLAQLRGVTLVETAAGREAGLAAIIGEGSTAALSIEGDDFVNVSKLDDLISENVTFIKLDIEGAELDALEGARNLILRCNPTMAVCVYHRADHFWKVPQLVLSINPNYSVFLRHYTESIYETVMYFVPVGVDS